MSLNRRSLIRRIMMALGAWQVPKVEARELAPGRFGELEGPVTQAQSSSSKVAESPQLAGYVRPGTIEVVRQKFDLVVVGGGIAGTCAAISAARNGVNVALVQERSTLAGVYKI